MIFRFDDAVMERLRELPVPVYDTLRPNDTRDQGKGYVVFTGGDQIQGTEFRHRPLDGYKSASVYHTFGITCVGPSPRVMRQIVQAVRGKMAGFRTEFSAEVQETGQLNAAANQDTSVPPTRYSFYMTYQTTIDRSV